MYAALREEGKKAEREIDAAHVTGTQPSLPLARYAGVYSDSLYGTATVKLEGKKLVVSFGPAVRGGSRALALRHLHGALARRVSRPPAHELPSRARTEQWRRSWSATMFRSSASGEELRRYNDSFSVAR